MERFGYVVKVLCVEPANRDSAVCGHVDAVYVAQLFHHLFFEAGEGEHTDLVDYVLPRVDAAALHESAVEALPHCVHTAGHHLEFAVPLLGQFLIIKYTVDQASSMDGRV